jgi:hypothetical protein
MNAISPEQLVLTALNDFAVRAVEAWKQNDDEAMSAALTSAQDKIIPQVRGTGTLYSALFRIVREDTQLGSSQGMRTTMGRFATIADVALREYQHLQNQDTPA